MKETIYINITLLQCACRPDCQLQALEFSDDIGGQRITSQKHSGRWRTVKTFKCSFEPDDLSLYATNEGFPIVLVLQKKKAKR
jgi:hypothetical protein